MTLWNVLVVDDEPLNLEIISDVLDAPAYAVTTATNGEEAWQAMVAAAVPPDVLVLDRMMPVLNGIELLKRIKADARFSSIPVVMQTAATSPIEVNEGIEAGAWYYLTKPYAPHDLLAVVRSALLDVAERRAAEASVRPPDPSLRLLTSAEFSFSTLEEAYGLSSTLAGICTEPGAVTMGLMELLVNAVEHGNLGISYQEKSQLRRDDRWEDEVALRLKDPVLGARRARVSVSRDAAAVSFTIADEGAGFDWTRYLDFDSERVFDPNGRGIAMACHGCFACVEYQGNGNTVVAKVRLS